MHKYHILSSISRCANIHISFRVALYSVLLSAGISINILALFLNKVVDPTEVVYLSIDESAYDDVNQILAAAQSWSDATGSSIKYVRDDSRSACDKNTIKILKVAPNDLYFTDGKTIGETYSSLGCTTIKYENPWNDKRYQKFLEMISFNSSVKVVMMHEFGHAFGVPHDESGELSVMTPNVNMFLYTVQCKDIESLSSIYKIFKPYVIHCK